MAQIAQSAKEAPAPLSRGRATSALESTSQARTPALVVLKGLDAILQWHVQSLSPSILSEAMANYRVSLSHGSQDKHLVTTHILPAVKQAGAQAFLDEQSIAYGDDFRKIILAELRRCDEIIVVLTASSPRADHALNAQQVNP